MNLKMKPRQKIDNIKLDKITPEYVIEVKKSDADLTAAKAQLEFYLFTLNQKGINRQGKLECVEKSKQDKKIHVINFNESDIQRLTALYQQIGDFLDTQHPPTLFLKRSAGNVLINRLLFYLIEVNVMKRRYTIHIFSTGELFKRSIDCLKNEKGNFYIPIRIPKNFTAQ